MSAAEGASEASSLEQAYKWAVWANERTDERVAHYFILYSWLFWPTLQCVLNISCDTICFEKKKYWPNVHHGDDTSVVTFYSKGQLGKCLTPIIRQVLSADDLMGQSRAIITTAWHLEFKETKTAKGEKDILTKIEKTQVFFSIFKRNKNFFTIIILKRNHFFQGGSISVSNGWRLKNVNEGGMEKKGKKGTQELNFMIFWPKDGH